MQAATVSGYVLAGGKSSRMGRDKALLELAGRPLVEHAVTKLRRVCAEVHILSSSPELEGFALLVSDVHPGCGPLGGVETALLHSERMWCLLMAVDMPFVPAALLDDWVRDVIDLPLARVAMFTVDGVPQPTLCLVHREVLPFVQESIQRGEYRLFPVLERAGQMLAAEAGVEFEAVFVNRVIGELGWFANLNTPEEFAAAERELGGV